MSHDCSRCEASFSESELIRKRERSGKNNFCGYCFLASKLLQETRGPIRKRKELPVHPVRVYSRALGKAVRARNRKEDSLEGAYDRLLTDTVEEHAPEFIQEHLEQAEKAIKGELNPFDERGEDSEGQEDRQEGLDSFAERGENPE
ncbi:hypothetical protein [Natrinema sp. H-ect4]|uniref:hypothetical protein n=1 Tax=Natrinema sp. H-ect4 TaxID=3242699 RepID=UPI0035A82A16